MKELIKKLILPITIISFALVTKWWYVLPTDARETFFWGFPFAFVGEGWHTSGSLQFFILEWLADLCIFFLFWLGIFYVLNQVAECIMPPKWIIRALWTLSLLVILGYGVVIACSYPIFKLKRDWDWEVIGSGYKFIWQQTPPVN
jgi:hypothetical protein